VEFAAPSEVYLADRVALFWLPALPPRRSRRPRGFPRSTSPPEPKPRKLLSWSLRPLQSRTTSRLPVLRSRGGDLRPHRVPSQPGIASLGVLAPSSTTTPGAPCRSHPGREAGAGRVKVAKPPPVPSSGFLPLSTVLAALAARTNPLRSPPFAVAPRRFAALFHAARAPGVALQSFPFSRSRTRSRGPPASLRVRIRPPNGAARPEEFAAPFPDRADLSPQLARRLAGLEGRDDGSLESLGAARHPLPGSSTTSRLESAGLAGLGGRHAHFEALLTSRVRSHDDRSLARARSSGRCSPGFFRLPHAHLAAGAGSFPL